MGSRTINCRKASIGLIEYEIEVGASQNDGFNAITPAQGLRQASQPCLVSFGDPSLRRQRQINPMDLIDFVI